jgi:hypothetical protein
VPGDNATIEAGITWSMGAAGEEYGGVPVFGETATSGGAFQGYLRWVRYF